MKENRNIQTFAEFNKNPDTFEILDYIINENIKQDFDIILKKVKKAAKAGLLTATIISSLLSPKYGFTKQQKEEIKKVAYSQESNIQETKNFKEYLSLLEKNPIDFYNKLETDTAFSSQVIKSFEKSYTRNYDAIEEFREKYFVDRGAATITSQSVGASKELNRGIVIKNQEHLDKVMAQERKNGKILFMFFLDTSISKEARAIQNSVIYILDKAKGTYDWNDTTGTE